MKKIIFLLFFISVLFACQKFNSTDLINTTMNFNANDCFYFEDLNITIKQNILDNSVVNLSPNQSLKNLATNTTYICNYNIENIFLMLNYGENYTNTRNMIFISAPPRPQANIYKILNYSEIYYNPEFNITIIAPPFQKINQNININENESYTNEVFNISVSCNIKNLNIYKNLNFNESFIDSIHNITIKSPNFPKINEVVNVNKCNFEKFYNEYNLSIKTLPCENRNINISLNSIYKVDFLNLTVISPKKIDKRVDLSNSEIFEDKENNLLVRCLVKNDEFIEFCKKTGIEPFLPIWTSINLTNFTCKNQIIQCIDNLTSYCNLEEKTTPTVGFINCFNRNIEEMNRRIKDAEDQRNTCLKEKDLLIADNNNMKAGIRETQETLLITLISVIVLIALALGTWQLIMYLKKKEGVV